jgi:hypothetical protein
MRRAAEFELKLWCSIAQAAVASRAEAVQALVDIEAEMDRARAGESRLREENTRLMEIAKALADALGASANHYRDDGPCWCLGPPETPDAVGHSPFICLPKRAALK